MNDHDRGRRKPLLLILGLLLVLLPACAAGPDPTFVAAARETMDAIAPEYLAYVEADPNLTREQRQRRLGTVVRFEEAIRAREARR